MHIKGETYVFEGVGDFKLPSPLPPPPFPLPDSPLIIIPLLIKKKTILHALEDFLFCGKG